MNAPFVLIPQVLADRIRAWGTSWGWLHLKYDRSENLVVVTGFTNKEVLSLPYSGFKDRGHYSSAVDTITSSGAWYRADPAIHDAYLGLLVRGAGTTTEAFQTAVAQGWRQPPADNPCLTVMFSDDGDKTAWSAWWVNRDAAVPCRFELVLDEDPLAFLVDSWSVDELANARMSVVGVGSIGSAAADALAVAGIGHVRLVDPGRLRQHNVARHRLGQRDVGRYKVNALAHRLDEEYPHLDVEAVVADVAADADVMRLLFSDSDVILCATDGVQARRVTNHLARRAGTPLVLAAVLEDGGYGELVRIQPRTGCLLCLRRYLEAKDMFDPEPGLDQDYGTGSPHRPMTAAPHDLRLMGQLAAQAAVATYLERRGHWTHRLPGDWAIVGLQPLPEMPPPFDAAGPGEVKWLPMVDRQADCPTCAPP